MRILDATAGSRGIWYQKDLPFVTFMDKREGRFVFYPNPKTKRTFDIKPDVLADWTKTIPFDNNEFDMVVFDPPHLIVSEKPKSDFKMHIQYSYFLKSNWKQSLRKAFQELFRVLKPDGFLVLKWCETDIKIMDVLKLSPYKPMFSNMSLEHNSSERNSYMVVFIKHRLEQELDID
jgi:SAM-dependent methyltransferase